MNTQTQGQQGSEGQTMIHNGVASLEFNQREVYNLKKLTDGEQIDKNDPSFISLENKISNVFDQFEQRG